MPAVMNPSGMFRKNAGVGVEGVVTALWKVGG